MVTADYLNPDLTPEARTQDLLHRMTLQEKAGQLFHLETVVADDTFSADEALAQAQGDAGDRLISHFNILNGTAAGEIATWHNTLQEIAEDTRLGIPVTLSSDPRHGFFSSPFTGQSIDAISRWPETTGLAATADPAVLRSAGDAVREEFLAMGIRVYLGPMADLFTDARWSRGYGTFGEDPAKVSASVLEFLRGLRGPGGFGAHSVAAVLKHFPGAGPQKDGNDAHDARFPEQVYPGHRQADHLAPFVAAFEAGLATQVMPYYSKPIGTDWDEVGFSFNKPVITGLLRDTLGFDGVVCSDWHIIEAGMVGDIPFGPNAYGLENVDPSERLRRALDAGVDQFGGDRCTERVIELVESGRLSMDRLEVSVRRILLEKFRLGLFEHRRVDPDAAEQLCGSAPLRERGLAAQRQSLTLLKATDDALPIRPGTRVYAEGIDWTSVTHGLAVVSEPSASELNIVRLNAPYQSDSSGPLPDFFHSGSLEFDPADVARVTELASTGPTVVAVYLERPAVLTPLVASATVLIGDYGAADQVLIDALTQDVAFAGHLPFDLPRSQQAVADSREDVPFDTKDPLFAAQFGLSGPAGR